MKKIVLSLVLVCSTLPLLAQLGVGTHSPNASAALDVTANDKGFLAPRIALTGTSDVTTIATPATGLLIYNTATAGVAPSNVVPGYYYFDGVKWVKFVNTLPEVLVDFDTADPNTGSPTFTPNTPQSGDAIYVSSVNSSLWVYNGTAYVSYTPPASTPFNLANSTTDAGGNKTSSIWRSGNVGIGFNNPAVPLDVRSSGISTFVTTARFQAPNNTTAGNATLLNFGVSSTTGNSADWRYVYQANGAGSNRVDFGMSGYAAPMMSYLNSGNVGIGTTGPQAKLHIQGILATNGANANGTMLRMSRPTHSGFKWGSVAQFNLGTYVDAGNNVDAKSRLDLALTNGNNETTLTNVMTWLANGRVGINNTDPNAPLVVQGATGTGALKLIAPSVAAGDNWWLGFGHGTTSTDANDRARIGAEIIAGGAGRLFFTTGSTGSQTRAMFIDENQRVGIGTSTPTARLDVIGGFHLRNAAGAAGTNFGIEFNTNSNAPRIDWVFDGAYIGQFASDANDFLLRNSKQTTGGFRFYTNPIGSQVERMAILNNGNVGINITTPASILHIAGVFTQDVTSQDNFSNGINIRKRGNATISSGAVTSGAEIGYHSFHGWNGTGYARGAYVIATAAENFTTSANGTNYAIFTSAIGTTGSVERLKIMHDGNVGIGTASPTQRLDVSGQVRIRTIETGVASDSILVVNGGVVKRVTKSAGVNVQTANYTLTATDNGNVLIMNSANAVTVTVPATLPAGFIVQIIQKGAGQVTVDGSGVTMNSANGFKTRTLNSAIGVVMETSTLGYLTGDSNF
jgi:hypothetical protein